MTHPLVKVASARLAVSSSIYSDDFKFYYWDMKLACGCLDERRCRYKPREGRTLRGFAAMHAGRPPGDVLPAPKCVRHRCPKE